MSSSSTNNRAGNAANVASSKRKSTTSVYQVGSSSKRVALQFLPTHQEPNNDQFNRVLALNHDDRNGTGPNQISFPANLLNSGGHTNYVDNVQSPLEAEDPFDNILKTQYERIRETCKQYFNNKYNDLMRQAEERASRIHTEKEMETTDLRSRISYLQEKVASDRAHLEQQDEVIKNINTELDGVRREYIEQEGQLVHFKSQAELWKEKADETEEKLWNAPSCCGDQEDTALSSVGQMRR